MVRIYGMPTCPHCAYLLPQIEGNQRFEFIDIGSHVRKLKEFLAIRDTNPLFDEPRSKGKAGIPCLVLEDGTVTLTPEDAGLQSKPKEEEAAPAEAFACASC